MARNIDYEFKEQLAMYIKNQWMLNGEQPFSKSIADIAKELRSQYPNLRKKPLDSLTNQIWHYLNTIERSGRIQIIKSKGPTANKFIYVSDHVIEEIASTKNICNNTIDDYIQKQNEITQDTVNMMKDYSQKQNEITQEMIDIMLNLKQKLVASVGNNNHLKSIIINLEYFGTGKDDMEIYMVPKGSGIKTIIEMIQNEFKNSYKNQANEENEKLDNEGEEFNPIFDSTFNQAPVQECIQ